jgi:DnaJ-class molecular chaperone
MNELWDRTAYPVHMLMDVDTHNDNIKAGRKLCEHCEGTGNEFLSMYHRCPKCGGTGRDVSK